MNVLLFLAGLSALVVGANLLVRGASRLALSLGVSPLVVGLTIVAFGTSAPEAAVAVGAVVEGRSDIAVGSVIGSNILNVLLILGASALIRPVTVNLQLIRQEVPIMICASALLPALMLDLRISRLEGTLLVGLLVAYVGFLVVQSRRQTRDARAAFAKEVIPVDRGAWDSTLPAQIALIAAGLACLVAGSDWLVAAAVAFARTLGVSDLVIALTVVAAGTSMPEAATSIAAAIKGERDIAVGNVVGSNTFNILGCIGLSGLASGNAGLGVPPAALQFDVWAMLAVAVACLPVFFARREIARWEGGFFLAYYAAYTAYVLMVAQKHDALGAYSNVMLGFVIPLTIVTLLATLLRGKV